VFTVHRPDGVPATCTVRARARDGVEVGRAVVKVPAGTEERARMRYTLETSRRPFTGEVLGCGPA
jgi:hypothetical protein